MAGFYNIFGVCALVLFWTYSGESTVTVRQVSGDFICGGSTRLSCTITPYGVGMTWKLDGTIIAQCAFGNCEELGALPSWDNFTYYETTGIFLLDIGITLADNGTVYQCDDGSAIDQLTVNIKVLPEPPVVSDVTITEGVSNTNISVVAGGFYQFSKARLRVTCESSSEELSDILMTPNGVDNTYGECAGPGIQNATATVVLNSGTCPKGTYSEVKVTPYHADYFDKAQAVIFPIPCQCGPDDTIVG